MTNQFANANSLAIHKLSFWWERSRSNIFSNHPNQIHFPKWRLLLLLLLMMMLLLMLLLLMLLLAAVFEAGSYFEKGIASRRRRLSRGMGEWSTSRKI